MTAKKKAAIIILIPLLIFVPLCLADPMGFVWKSHTPIYSNLDMRYLASTAISNPRYNSFILGTSMLESTSSREVEKYFPNTHFANISMAGCTFTERAIILNYILEQDRMINMIIYSFDPNHYIEYADQKEDIHIDNFLYLYDHNRINDFKFYFCYRALKDLFYSKTVAGKDAHTEALNDFNCPRSSKYNENALGKFDGGLRHWLAVAGKDAYFARTLNDIVQLQKNNAHHTLSSAQKDRMVHRAISYCEDNLFAFVEAYPNVNFYVIIPPYSRVRFATWHQYEPQKAAIHEAVIRYCTKRASELKNLHVFGYEDMDFLDDLRLYRDTMHYHYDINSFMAKSLVSGEHELNASNVETYIKTAREKALKFDLISICNTIESYLRKQK